MIYKKNKAIKKKIKPIDIITYNANKPKGIKSYHPKSHIKTAVGVVLVVFGLVSLPLPSGSLICLGVGCGLLGLNLSAKLHKLQYEVNLIKLRVVG